MHCEQKRYRTGLPHYLKAKRGGEHFGMPRQLSSCTPVLHDTLAMQPPVPAVLLKRYLSVSAERLHGFPQTPLPEIQQGSAAVASIFSLQWSISRQCSAGVSRTRRVTCPLQPESAEGNELCKDSGTARKSHSVRGWEDSEDGRCTLLQARCSNDDVFLAFKQ